MKEHSSLNTNSGNGIQSDRRRISFYTLGCRLNQSETAVIKQTFQARGYRIVDFDKPADIVVINTCTVTENGDADTRRLVNKINRLNPKVKIALVGCQAQIQKEKLTELNNVRWVVGNAKKMDLADILHESSISQNESESPQIIAPPIPRTHFTMPLAAIDRDHTRANLKIQDGCDFFCSFCEIPYARGRARSREFEDMIKEAKILVEAGHKEIVLTGINIGTYDLAQKKLLEVLDALENIDGILRIRISSIEPTTIPSELFNRMTAGSKLCRYLHIPLQSGDDTILELMKRRYRFQEFSDFVNRVAAEVPEICIGTDVIVGFPGETDARFETTYKRLHDLPLAYFHVFSYSERHFARSQHFSDPIKSEIIQRRSQMLRDLSARKRLLFFNSMLESVQSVLFEQKKDGLWSGLTDNYIRVAVESSENMHNQIRPVRLTGIHGQCMKGILIN